MIEYQEFLCYALENDGTHKEMEIEEDQIEEKLHPDDVLIFIKQDMRRLWIWKGPKAPVRKRFISSRVAAKIQEEIRRESGRHLKIVSVDAGDEPTEFLSTFNLDSMETTEKINDMVYIRNIERDRLKEEEIKKTVQKTKSDDEYWSPILEETEDSTTVHSSILSESAPTPRLQTSTHSYPRDIPSKRKQSKKDDQEIIIKILESEPPKGMTRVNIIVGTRLYAPSKKTSEVFGEKIETETWEIVSKLPKDVIDFTTKQIRVYTDKDTGEIQATVVYKKDQKPTKPEESVANTSAKTKRELPKIPSTEE